MKLLTKSTAFETAQQQNSDNNGHLRTTEKLRQITDVGEARTPRKVMSTPATINTDGSTGGSTKVAQSVCLASRGTVGGCTAGGGGRKRTAGEVLPVAGAHVPILNLTASLPTPMGDVPKVLQGVNLEDQCSQAMDVYKFLNTPSPSLPPLNEGAKCYVALVNVPKTSLVKLIYCMGMGSSPIGANASPVDGKRIFLQGGSNADLGPPQPVFLPDNVVKLNAVAVITVAQFFTSITSKVAGYSYPLLAPNALNTSGGIMQIAPIPTYFVYNGFEQYVDAALVLERVMSVNQSVNNMFTHLPKNKCLLVST